MNRVELEIDRLINELNFPEAKELFGRLNGGKRLRARLILTIAPDAPTAPLLGAIVELIHAASLLHDDVIDESSTRRGVESVNATEGSKIAIMLGDILYSKAFSELSGFDAKIAKSVATSVTNLSIGEMMDVQMSSSFNTNRELYKKMLYLKTATLIESAAYSAALLAGKDATSHSIYGRNLGIAFQVVDDILDIISDDATLGKPALNDFVEGKTTLPYMELYEKLGTDERERLKSYHLMVLDETQKLWIKSKMDDFGVIESSYRYAKELCDEAIAVVDDEALKNIIETVIKRSY